MHVVALEGTVAAACKAEAAELRQATRCIEPAVNVDSPRMHRERLDSPAKVVSVGGVVRSPGEYPLEPGMRVSDLLRAGGRASDGAYSHTAELTRYEVTAGERRETS